ncbi:MAG: hypothetical protein Q9217_001559 [Psora testacea]
MDGIESVDLPRKKPKLEHDSMNDWRTGLLPSISHENMSLNTARLHAGDDLLDKEDACGITEYVSPDSLGFSGTLKKRYTDFLVNEILPSGEVVHLTNLKAPKGNEQKAYKTPSTPNPGTHGSHNFAATSAIKVERNIAVNGPKNEGLLEKILPSAEHEALNNTPIPTPSPNNDPKSFSPFAGDGTRDRLAYHFEELPPHKRVSITKPDKNNKSPESGDVKDEDTARTKQKVQLRRTSQGWIEVDEALERAEKEQKDKKTTERVANDKDDVAAPQGALKDDAAAEPNNVYAPQASTLASWNAYAGVRDRFDLPKADQDVLVSYFPTEVVDAIRSLYNHVITSPDRSTREYGTVRSAIIDRQTRGKIHQEIRRIFNSKLESQTDDEGRIIISAIPKQPTFYGRYPPSQNDRSSNRNYQTWKNSAARGKSGCKEFGGDYLHFSLYKENKDTMESISHLARQLNMKPQAFQFAGTKDRRGVTVQRVSAYRIFIDRVIRAGKTLRNAYVGDYEYLPNPLQLGELTGNEFVITLRDCDFHYPEQADSMTVLKSATSIVGEAIRNLGELGFINYYGLQRFGTFGISTDTVGLAMLQGDFKRAVDAILYYKPACLETESDPPTIADSVSRDDRYRAQAIRLFLDNGDSYHALNDLPRKFSAEASIIRHLSKKGHHSDYLGALQTISRNLRLMYVHAYQSLVWNMAASERWRKFGSTVVEGDLVQVDEHKEDDPANKKEEVDTDGEVVIQPAEHDRATNHEDIFTRARALSKVEVRSGRYTIFDIVLPTPGYDILYPNNAIGDFYRSFMASERGGGLNPHDMRRSWKDISLSGSYRKLLAKPGKNITFEIKTYEEDDEQFVETDIDRYYKTHPKQDHRGGQGPTFSRAPTAKEESKENKTQAPSQPSSSPTASNNDLQTSIPATTVPTPTADLSSSSVDTHAGGGVRLDWNCQPKADKKIAVIFKLQLGVSQYATMALRELMKQGGVKTYKMDYSGGR